jgi:hypothetical protein
MQLDQLRKFGFARNSPIRPEINDNYFTLELSDRVGEILVFDGSDFHLLLGNQVGAWHEERNQGHDGQGGMETHN